MNNILLIGKLKDFRFNYSFGTELFYENVIEVSRTNGNKDMIIIVISERVYADLSDLNYSHVKIIGDIRTRHSDGKLCVYVFVKQIELCDMNDDNIVELDGYLCNVPSVRETPLGRTITDVILATHRVNGKSDYIPTIFWGRNAHDVTNNNIGTNLIVYGRLQSRDYSKDNQLHTAYEVSVYSYSKK